MSRIKILNKPLAEINVVPYIDVMLVLLVIFMVTAPLLTQGIKVNLPRANTKIISAKQQLPIVVSVNANGDYYLNVSRYPNKRIALSDLQVRLAAELHIDKKRKVYLRADKTVAYGAIVQLMANLQQAGIDNIGLITLTKSDNS